MQMLALPDTSYLLQPQAMTKPRLVWTLGDVFRKVRQARGLTQGRLALRAQVNRTTVNELETGKVDSDQETQRRIARALGVTMADVYAYLHDVNLLLGLAVEARETVRDLADGLRPSVEQPPSDAPRQPEAIGERSERAQKSQRR